MFRFNHFNFNVLDLNKSLDFYQKALGFTPIRTKDTDDFTLVFIGDGSGTFSLELTYLKERKEPYDIGEAEFHLAVTTPDMEKARAWYHSPAYQEAARHRFAGAVYRGLIVEGTAPPETKP